MRPSFFRLFVPLITIIAGIGQSAYPLDIPVTIVNRGAAPKTLEPVSGGIPFARGVLADVRNLRLTSGGKELPSQFLATAKWPDGSVRWALVDTEVDLPASGSVSATLQTAAASPITGVTATEGADSIAIDTGTARETLRKSELLLRGFTFDVASSGRSYRATPNSWTIEESGPVKVVIRAEGTFNAGSDLLYGQLIGFRARLTWYRNRDDVRVALTCRNRSGFNWDGSMQRGPDAVLGGAAFGTALAPTGGSYTFGPGVEKTWVVLVPRTGSPSLHDTRFLADGSLASGSVAMPPLLVATPAYYASTNAWGTIALPVQGTANQADFDRFEKLQLAKVSTAALENPPNSSGETVWGHLAVDLGSWNDYGDLRWAGNGCGSLSGNHYDWPFGMYLQFMRTGRLEFADAARVFARHEIDFDIYHTGEDGAAYNFQKNWEDRASHDSPQNCFGGGRPTHTWTQGYALHWLLTGDRRGLDAFNELQEGIRQYLYESFVDNGHVNTNEIRTQG